MQLVYFIIVSLLLTSCSTFQVLDIKGKCWYVTKINKMSFPNTDSISAAHKIIEIDTNLSNQIKGGKYTYYSFDSLPNAVGVWPFWKKSFDFQRVLVEKNKIIFTKDGYTIEIIKISKNQMTAIYYKETGSLGPFTSEMILTPISCLDILKR